MPTLFRSKLFIEHFSQISRKSVSSRYPINSFEENASHQNRSASFRLQKKYKHVMPFLRVVSTMGSHCEPPANDMIGPRKFTAGKMALPGKAIVFLVTFHPS